jgi:hypothetical protein
MTIVKFSLHTGPMVSIPVSQTNLLFSFLFNPTSLLKSVDAECFTNTIRQRRSICQSKPLLPNYLDQLFHIVLLYLWIPESAALIHPLPLKDYHSTV